MSVILGIDAAWTATQPSGVALVVSDSVGWRCAAVAPSYEAFFRFAQGIPVDWNVPQFPGSAPSARKLLDAACQLAKAPVGIIVIDMPVSTEPIVGRRAADNEISMEFGKAGCPTHSPSEKRPGLLGATFCREFAEAGYSIATTSETCSTRGRLLEVYPHPAILALLRCRYRVPYKVSKSRRYWPGLPAARRTSRLINEFIKIYGRLPISIGSWMLSIPAPDATISLAGLKRYEDALDALVCAWVGIRYVHGAAVPYGDRTSAIWCPR